MSRLLSCSQRIFVKTELDNPSGSHKFRAAKHIVEKAIACGEIIPGKTTVIEKTGGGFGFGLIAACSQYGVDVDLAIGLSFSKRKRDLLEFLGAKLIGKEMLAAGFTPKQVVQHHLENQQQLGKQYFYTDQFQNTWGMEAHRIHTGAELVTQLRQQGCGERIVFVGCAGTGASFTGVSLALRDCGFDVKGVLVEPDGCNMSSGTFVEHRIEGASVGVPAPFLDWSLVHAERTVSLEEVIASQRWFYLQTGLWVGNSSAASLAAARELEAEADSKECTFVTLAYDSGLWYDDYAHLRS